MLRRETGFLPHHGENVGILVECYVLLGITMTFIVLRAYVACRITHIFDLADVSIFVATACLIANVAFSHLAVSQGMGQHLYYLADPQYQSRQVRKWNTFVQITNVGTTLFTKYSISLYILRIRRDRRLKIVLGVLMFFMTLAALAAIIVISVSCVPLRALWDPSVPGKCLPLRSVYVSTYVQSGFTIIVDLALTASPIVILWNVKIHRWRKTVIITLMSLGLIATATNAARNPFIAGLTAPDFTYAMIPVTVLASIEAFSGVIAACIPPCTPLVTHKMRKKVVEARGAYDLPSVTNNHQPVNASDRMGHRTSIPGQIQKNSESLFTANGDLWTDTQEAPAVGSGDQESSKA